jgi:hypothetical protein
MSKCIEAAKKYRDDVKFNQDKFHKVIWPLLVNN